MIHTSYYQSPLGTILLKSNNHALTELNFSPIRVKKERVSGILCEATRQLDEYFAGKRREFTIPVYPQGTHFQLLVWKALTTIPYGRTTSYLDIATQIENPKAAQATGAAMKNNPIAIIIPCHRVIKKNGKVAGYAFGVWRKEWLLTHEKAY
jgi:methylated-DNA-[protein]-cysteine S-methyltransferase